MSERGSAMAMTAEMLSTRRAPAGLNAPAERHADWHERAARLAGAICGDKLALSIEETAARTGISRSQLFELIADPKSGFPFFKVRRRTYVPTVPLLEWMSRGGAPSSSDEPRSAALRDLEETLS